MKILAVTWNTQSCNNTNICEWIGSQISLSLPDLVCIGFQEDQKPGSSFHSKILPVYMGERNYKLLKRARLMGIGKTSIKNYSMRGLRLSVYILDKYYQDVIQYESSTLYCAGNGSILDPYKVYLDSQEKYEQEDFSSKYLNKGSVAIYVSHKLLGTICIINSHFPFHSGHIFPENIISQTRDNTITFEQNRMMNDVYAKFIHRKDRYGNKCSFNIERPSPDHIIHMGDMNYRVNPYISDQLPRDSITMIDQMSGQFIRDMYNIGDELLHEMNRKIIPYMSEGIDNNGPNFAPTCKMSKPRLINKTSTKHNVIPYYTAYGKYKPGIKRHRFPSWTDRILYKSEKMICLEYNRFYVYGIMDNSDHDGVYAIFKI